eukprot:TRINITY_DN5928_c0_g1_i1.p1 TRINITY_DN5928_c0_g1~~TRINITY_DN5928_c0_g1_i1.p1  ORF type:complete len:783 (-),score=180.04 TRINITY_DN5928_c0_g1_i1:34-2382(-)
MESKTRSSGSVFTSPDLVRLRSSSEHAGRLDTGDYPLISKQLDHTRSQSVDFSSRDNSSYNSDFAEVTDVVLPANTEIFDVVDPLDRACSPPVTPVLAFPSVPTDEPRNAARTSLSAIAATPPPPLPPRSPNVSSGRTSRSASLTGAHPIVVQSPSPLPGVANRHVEMPSADALADVPFTPPPPPRFIKGGSLQHSLGVSNSGMQQDPFPPPPIPPSIAQAQYQQSSFLQTQQQHLQQIREKATSVPASPITSANSTPPPLPRKPAHMTPQPVARQLATSPPPSSASQPLPQRRTQLPQQQSPAFQSELELPLLRTSTVYPTNHMFIGIHGCDVIRSGERVRGIVTLVIDKQIPDAERLVLRLYGSEHVSWAEDYGGSVRRFEETQPLVDKLLVLNEFDCARSRARTAAEAKKAQDRELRQQQQQQTQLPVSPSRSPDTVSTSDVDVRPASDDALGIPLQQDSSTALLAPVSSPDIAAITAGTMFGTPVQVSAAAVVSGGSEVSTAAAVAPVATVSGGVTTVPSSEEHFGAYPGCYCFPFDFEIPRGLPRSFECEQDRISYTLRATVDGAGRVPIMWATKPLLMMENVPRDLPSPWTEASKTFLFGGDAPTVLRVGMHTALLSPGQELNVRMQVSNPGTKTISTVILTCTQHFKVKAQGLTRTMDRIIARHTEDPSVGGIAPHTMNAERFLHLRLPVPLVPSIAEASLIHIGYSLKVELSVHLAGNLEATIPIYIAETEENVLQLQQLQPRGRIHASRNVLSEAAESIGAAMMGDHREVFMK